MTFEEELIIGLIITIFGAVLTALGWFLKKYWNKIIIFFKRIILKVIPQNFNFALSIEFKEGINTGNYFEEVKKNLKSTILDNNLNGLVILQDISDLKKFNSPDEAVEFLKKKNLNLLVWGSLSPDSLKSNGKNINVFNLRFTWLHPKDKHNKLGRMMALDINSKLAYKRYWKIMEESSYDDLKIVGDNLSEISIYILALSLKVFGQINSSLHLFETLFNKSQDEHFKEMVKPHLLNCYELIICDSIYNKNSYSIAESSCLNHLRLNPNTHFGLSNLALFQFKLGKINDSKKTIADLCRIYPLDPITIVDAAFFYVLEKDYHNAYKSYNKLVSYRPEQIKFNFLDVVEFLTDQYKINNDPALLYGSGLISFYFGDKALGNKDLKHFLRKANDTKYKKMIEKVKKILT